MKSSVGINRALEATYETKYTHWMDFGFFDGDRLCPVTIVVAYYEQIANLNNCKFGIYYALTGKPPPFQASVLWREYFRLLRENMESNDRDYYFLFVYKMGNSKQNIFATSLKGLSKVWINGSLPFRIKWNENLFYQSRDYEAAKNFLLQQFKKSVKRRTEVYNDFGRYFKEFMKDDAVYFTCRRCGYKDCLTFSHDICGTLEVKCKKCSAINTCSVSSDTLS